MARLPRSTFPPHGVWHVTTRGVARQRVYRAGDDGRAFLKLFAESLDRFPLHVLALCLMPNHYHLVTAGKRDAVSGALHHLNGEYAERFNRKYGRSGHLWGDRFALWQIRDEEHLHNACTYVLANPVRAGLCERASDWRWSRYAS